MKQFSLWALALAGGYLLALSATAKVVNEDFSSDPSVRGWTSSGDTSLFRWSGGALEVTWDSSRPNSYFALPVGGTLGTNTDFSVSFDLLLTEFAAGTKPGMPNPFQLSVGFLNLAEAQQETFCRGSGFGSPNVVDFGFFPDPGEPWMWGPSITTTLIDRTATNWSTGGFGPFGLEAGKTYRVSLAYTATNLSLSTSLQLNGEAVGEISVARLGARFFGFALDHFAICSYSEAGQDPAYAGSVFAKGVVDNIELTLPAPELGDITGGFSGGQWQVRFFSQPKWNYALERTGDFSQWESVTTLEGNGDLLTLTDANAPAGSAWYRVSAAPKP